MEIDHWAAIATCGSEGVEQLFKIFLFFGIKNQHIKRNVYQVTIFHFRSYVNVATNTSLLLMRYTNT